MSDIPIPQIDTLARVATRVLRLPFALRGGAPDFPAVRAVQQHWESLRGSRIAPARAEVDPRPLAECLDVMFVAELVAPGVARLRLSGQHLADLLGMEPRGMPLSIFFTGPGREELAQALLQVAQGARVTLPLRADSGFGQPGLDGLLALMPLTDRDGRISRVLGALETLGPLGRTPRRFRTTAPLQRSIDAAQNAPLPGQPFRVITGGKA